MVSRTMNGYGVINQSDRRTIRNITSEIQADNGAKLLAAIAEQNLEKYGYTIGDYFESPTAHSVIDQTGGTDATKSVKFKYYLADMDAWYTGANSGAGVNTHHVELFIDFNINRKWHSSSTITSVGYTGSTLFTYTTGDLLTAIKADMIALFGGTTGLEHLLSHTLKLASSVSSNVSSTTDTSTYIHNPSQMEVIGSVLCTLGNSDPQDRQFIKKLTLFDKFNAGSFFAHQTASLCTMTSAGDNVVRATYFGYNLYVSAVNPQTALRATGLIMLH